jgi:hypothetical protein
VIETAKAMLSVPHSGERLEKVWHVTGVFTVPELKKAVSLALQEYLLSEDKGEAARCVKELGVPHYHHEVVYRLIVLTLEKMPASPSSGGAGATSASATATAGAAGMGAASAGATTTTAAFTGAPAQAAAAATAQNAASKALALLVHLRQCDIVSEQQVAKGFERAAAALPDIKLDVPHAAPAFASLVHAAVEAGVLPGRLAATLTRAQGGGSAGGAGGASGASGTAAPTAAP